MNFLDLPSNCVFPETDVFFINMDQKNMVSVMANSNDTCQIYLLLAQDYIFLVSHMWTTAVKEDIEIYAGFKDDMKLFLKFK